MKKVKGLSKKKKKHLIDTDNSIMINRGKRGRGGWRGSKGGINSE